LCKGLNAGIALLRITDFKNENLLEIHLSGSMERNLRSYTEKGTATVYMIFHRSEGILGGEPLNY
jgi:hypothetical protein